jgi:putative SOS response-associated peptidase YedK
MPVILTSETMARWIGDQPLAADALASLVRPLDAGRMESRPVSRFVSNSRNQGPGCLAPPDEAPPQTELDLA